MWWGLYVFAFSAISVEALRRFLKDSSKQQVAYSSGSYAPQGQSEQERFLWVSLHDKGTYSMLKKKIYGMLVDKLKLERNLTRDDVALLKEPANLEQFIHDEDVINFLTEDISSETWRPMELLNKSVSGEARTRMSRIKSVLGTIGQLK